MNKKACLKQDSSCRVVKLDVDNILFGKGMVRVTDMTHRFSTEMLNEIQNWYLKFILTPT